MAGEALDRVLAPLYEQPWPSSGDVLLAVLTAYKEDTGEILEGGELTAEQRGRVRTWLVRLLREETSSGAASLMFKPRHLDHLPLYADMASKVSWLNQHQCPTCSTGSSSVALRTFPIEVPPWSHQVKIARQIGPALRKAIQANPMYASHFKPLDYGGVCLRLLFVLDDGARMKDCDNMAKGLIDAFQGLLYGNDRQVEHLDVLNIHGATGSNGYILVRFQGTNLNDHGDVIDPTHGRIAWLDAESLRLHDFLALEA